MDDFSINPSLVREYKIAPPTVAVFMFSGIDSFKINYKDQVLKISSEDLFNKMKELFEKEGENVSN